WAKGPCLDFLTSHITSYHAAAMAVSTHSQVYLDSVVNEYFSKFPWRLKVSENPTALALEANATEQLLEVEMEQKQCKVTAMCKVMDCILATLKVGNVLHPENDMWNCLLVQLSGISKKKPKVLQAHQQWSKDHFNAVVRHDFKDRCSAQGIKGKVTVSFCECVTCEHFLAMYVQMQACYAQLAKHEADAAIAQWNNALIIHFSHFHDSSSFLHSAIDRLPSFAGPLLSGMHIILGMHITLIVGGPEPRKGGNITYRMHEGGDKSPVPRSWQGCNQSKYWAVTCFFQEYLDNCYS
ncbi:hypothetical protein EDC04DRAFT_2528123, partial [Pisolithus marmoratus]